MYNRTYLEDMALKGLEAEADALEGEQAQNEADEAAALGTIGAVAEEIDTMGSENTVDLGATAADNEGESRFTQEQIEERMREILPATIDDIREFADNYDAPEQVEGVFKWGCHRYFL